MSERRLKGMRNSGAFRAESEGSIPFTSSILLDFCRGAMGAIKLGRAPTEFKGVALINIGYGDARSPTSIRIDRDQHSLRVAPSINS